MSARSANRRRPHAPARPAETLEARTLLRAFVVDTLTDDADDAAGERDGLVSLREAITAANRNLPFGDAQPGDAGGDTITFDADLVAGGSASLTIENGEFAILDDVELSTPETLVIKAGGVSRHFLVNTTEPVRLEGLELNNGRADNGGGSIRAINADLTLAGMDFTSNRAGEADGGAVLAAGGSLTIEDTQFSDNEARDGGAVAAIREMNVVMTSVQAYRNAAAGNGGAFSFGAGDQTVVNSRLGIVGGGNTAGILGGHISKIGPGTLTVNASILAGGVAGSDGGGVSVRSGSNEQTATLRMRNRTILDRNDAAGNGGGVSVLNAVVDLAAAAFSQNTAAGDGGGLHALRANVTFAGTDADRNRAARGGGFAFDQTVGLLSGSELNGNGSAATTTAAGGGVFVTGATSRVRIGNGRFTSNVADAGGAVAAEAGARLDLLNGSLLASNRAEDPELGGGGAAYLDAGVPGGLLNVSGSLLQDNVAEGRGGGVAVFAGRLTALNTTVDRNNAPGGGGGLFVGTTEPSLLRDTVVGGLFGNNTARSSGGYATGGGILHAADGAGRLTLANSAVRGNRGEDGAGVFSSGTALLLIRTGSEVTGNVSDGGSRGAGVFKQSGTVSLQQATVSGHVFTEDNGNLGGGVYGDNAAIALVNSVVADNVASRGGGINARGGRVIVTNSTVGQSVELPGNRALLGGESVNEQTASGGGIRVTGGRLTLRNARIIGNLSEERGGGVAVLDSTVVSQNGTEFAGNTAAAPDGSDVEVAAGGGLHADADSVLSFSQTTFESNTARTPLPGGIARGGGVAAEESSVAFVNSTVVGNAAEAETFAAGGGLYAADASVVLQRSTIGGELAGNRARAFAGVAWGGGVAVLNDGLFDGSRDDGHAVRVVGTSLLSNAVISAGGGTPIMGPFPSSPAGGGLAVRGGTFEMRGGSLVSGNAAPGLGGGLFVSASSAVLQDSRIEQNTVTAYGPPEVPEEAFAAGGGAYLSADATRLFRLSVTDNQSDRDGGGLSLFGTSAELAESTVTGNTAAADGGGLGDGGGLHRTVSEMTILDSVIAGNSPDDDFETPSR